jgi:hypothetical protein
MGLRFDLRIANWLAHVLDERMPVPKLSNDWEEQEALGNFLRSLRDRDRFYSSPWGRRRFEDIVDAAEKLLKRRDEPLAGVLAELRHFLADRPWTALLVPSGANSEIDKLMCSSAFLQELIFIRPDDPGLVLQMEDPPQRIFSLTDVFPAFRTALAASTEWPGVLLWTQRGDSIFLSLSVQSSKKLVEQAHWIFSHLGTAIGVDLELLKEQYYREFPEVSSRPSERITIVHLSDIHLGCREAGLRLPRVQDILSNLINDLGADGEAIIPLVSGDLMDSPEEENLDRVRAFLSLLGNLGTEPPIVLLGNHDVRKDGYLSEDLRMAMQVDKRAGLVKWFEDLRLGIACFDSVRDGKLARGYIGERQFLDMGSDLDSKCRGHHDYIVIAALHHHPIPVEIPDWYARPFYERVLGGAFEKTDELEDASDFVAFVEQRQCAAVLHGHKHIPRLDSTSKGIPVIGCGSTVGKVRTRDKRPFMSINLVTINRATNKLSARLLAERIAGGGLGEYKSHEIVWSPEPTRTYQVTS